MTDTSLADELERELAREQSANSLGMWLESRGAAILAALRSALPGEGVERGIPRRKLIVDYLNGHATDLTEADWDEDNAAAAICKEAAAALSPPAAAPDEGLELLREALGLCVMALKNAHYSGHECNGDELHDAAILRGVDALDHIDALLTKGNG